MTVASRELNEQLYKLSGWNDTDARWYVDDGYFITTERLNGLWMPAYSLDYLLDKLPKTLTFPAEPVEYGLLMNLSGLQVSIGYTFAGYKVFADDEDPTNAATKLAIALFEQGVLHKGGEKS